MDISIIWWVVAGLSVALALAIVAVLRLYKRLKQEVFRKRSQSSRYGKLTEQFLPLVDSFPWDPSNFRFLGSPVDGVQFAEDRIIFVEFKVGGSQLTKTQRHIRDMVKANKVDFRVLKIK